LGRRGCRPAIAHGAPDVDVIPGRPPGVAESRWHDADDLDRITVDRDRASDGSRIPAEAAVPVAIADDREVGDAGGLVCRPEDTPERWRHAEDGEIVPAHEQH